MISALNRIKNQGIDPDIVVDIGAAKGSWTQKSSIIWPDSKYVLIEPLKEQIEAIPAYITENKSIEILEAVAGEQAGTVDFTVTADLDGSGVYGGEGSENRRIKVVALDDILSRNRDKKYLLKLDTHGFEMQIFSGAEQILKSTEAIIVEVYGFHVSPTAKLFHKVSAYLFDKGFRLFDIVDIMRRPGDNAFWQADAVYLRSEHEVFRDNHYKN